MDKGFLTESLKDELMKIASMMGIQTDDSEKETPKNFKTNKNIELKSKIVGSSWNSCKSYKSQGGLGKWGKNIKIEQSPSKFELTYKGPSSGLNIAHASGGKDTLHQMYNVLICELNPYLANGGKKPNIENIKTKSMVKGKNVMFKITIPLSSSDKTWQIDRRGGWGHDPGESKMNGKCNKLESRGETCIGPIQNVSTGDFGKITEYFITHTI